MTIHRENTELAEPTLNQLRDRYARAIVQHGVGLLPGQDLYLHAPARASARALRIGEAAYDLGASRVHYRFITLEERDQLIRRASADSLKDAIEVDLRSWHLEILRSRSPLVVLSDIAPSGHHERLARKHATQYDLYIRGFGEIAFGFMRQVLGHPYGHGERGGRVGGAGGWRVVLEDGEWRL
jgi:hypothetical protein